MKNNFLISHENKFKDNRISYDGGRSEKQWWIECDRRGIPCIVVYKHGGSYAVKWDFITICVKGFFLNETIEFYEKIKQLYVKYWKLKKRPYHYGSTGRIEKLSLDEATSAAGEIFEILESVKVRKEGLVI